MCCLPVSTVECPHTFAHQCKFSCDHFQNISTELRIYTHFHWLKVTSVYLSNHSPLNSAISLHFRYHREYQEIKDIGPTGLRQLNYSAFLCRRLRKIPNWIYPCDFSLPIRRLIVWTCCTNFV